MRRRGRQPLQPTADTPHLPLAHGFQDYLCAFRDLASKHVVGWPVAAAMPEELVTTALQRAFWSPPPAPGLLVHSDRGGRYCGKAYRMLLHNHEAVRSQSCRGDCDDNAQAESRWSRLKTEVLESMLHSDNPHRLPFGMETCDIHELWRVRGYVSSYIPSAPDVTVERL
ncbi:hypothetical protein AUC43_04025 [Hymenobacter sedentarius]|uniref:Integrase catalytic domain-containing protein n=1 Tax=Hymenobacter sedentarius TaxID=1411621 RepID=A0A0U4C834_9BACT|nr:DDE-type integrase/transposase/recombinase [Hymenobacter sedentarius]ALW84329.1 hypothetical protein AUC43_04025 [Hymenobacter sedentarius]